MIPALLSIPILLVLVMVQSVMISRLPLLNGTADLVLLVIVAWAIQDRVKSAWIWAIVGGLLVSFVSAMPFFIPLISYLVATAMARLLLRRIWQIPILALFVTVLAASLISNGLALVGLTLTGTPLPLREALSLVVVPSTLLNLALSLPVYALVNDMASWMYPIEVEA